MVRPIKCTSCLADLIDLKTISRPIFTRLSTPYLSTPQPHTMPAYQWANSVQRRNHKERAQVADKQKWGLLEKRKVRNLALPHTSPSNQRRTTNFEPKTTAKRRRSCAYSSRKPPTATPMNSPTRCCRRASTRPAARLLIVGTRRLVLTWRSC